MRFAISTFGCKVNQYESSLIEETFKRGEINGFENSGNLHVINSCTVTENADRKVKSLISRLKKEEPGVTVVLCGCFPKAFPEKAKATGADIIIPGKFNGLESLQLFSLQENRTRAFSDIEDSQNTERENLFSPQENRTRAFSDIENSQNTERENLFSPQENRTRAFLKIQEGCNRDCSYCIIPRARGAPKSREIAEIVTEAQRLVAAGHKEIVIIGINMCLHPEFIGVTEAVCKIPGAERVRLSSLEPDLLSVSDIKRLAALPNLCGHFHLSLQSGSDTVLKRMNRRYTTNEFREIVDIIRKSFPQAALTTDIIVGFPGETEEEFLQTLAFAEEIAFAKIHAFAFSPREGTVAANMPEQLPKLLKKERVARLCSLAEKMRSNFFSGLIGSVSRVLVEKYSDGFSYGHTSCYSPVKIARLYSQNDIIEVRITGANQNECIGEAIPRH
ncbi:MAG: tRNA (N(6)-L-threonylcarbamoyladenosine(37)-C(2))-methylthiotransferase MtaB [Oscillospiraceae bacterium]|nr:tRNA (N(6)-L-threonylcarbamoyladenosine(37)-C(2))-methylthiotransferase MtaB [Oscillospiraceae bacterium]